MNYLYNGVELPELPEWDKQKYPYAIITADYTSVGDVFSVYAFVTDQPLMVTKYGTVLNDAAGGTIWGMSCTIKRFSDWQTDIVWVGPEGWSAIGSGEPLWVNYDLYAYDGTLYLAASDPIPVSSFTLDPISMTMGWLVGRRIAGQRK